MRSSGTLNKIENDHRELRGSSEFESIVAIEYLDHLASKGYSLVKLMSILEYITSVDMDDPVGTKNELNDAITRVIMDPDRKDENQNDTANIVYQYRKVIELFDLIEVAQSHYQEKLRVKFKEQNGPPG